MKFSFSILITFICALAQTSAGKKGKQANTGPSNSGQPVNSQSINTAPAGSSRSGILPPDYYPTDSPHSLNQEMARIYQKVSNPEDFMTFCNKLFRDYYPQAPNTCKAFYNAYVPPEPTQQPTQVPIEDLSQYSNIAPKTTQSAFFDSLNALKNYSSSKDSFISACAQSLSAVNGMGLTVSEKKLYCSIYYQGNGWQKFNPAEIGDMFWTNLNYFMPVCMEKTYYSPTMCADMRSGMGQA